mmetsp:Transcript_102891/g.185678  ORF Transcript_102891/g.185678 Transcript_102891/m.185678 type:complete len:238 (+) Transcript_102891:128-841(+)
MLLVQVNIPRPSFLLQILALNETEALLNVEALHLPHVGPKHLVALLLVGNNARLGTDLALCALEVLRPGTSIPPIKEGGKGNFRPRNELKSQVVLVSIAVLANAEPFQLIASDEAKAFVLVDTPDNAQKLPQDFVSAGAAHECLRGSHGGHHPAEARGGAAQAGKLHRAGCPYATRGREVESLRLFVRREEYRKRNLLSNLEIAQLSPVDTDLAVEDLLELGAPKEPSLDVGLGNST